MENKDFVIPDTPLVKDIKYLTKERDYELEQLGHTIQLNFSEEVAREQLEKILVMNKRLKLLEDQLIINRVSEANNEK